MVLGALFIEFVPKWAENLSKHLHYNEGTVQPTVLYGLILLAVLFVAPGGAGALLGQAGAVLNRARRWLYSRAESRATA